MSPARNSPLKKTSMPAAPCAAASATAMSTRSTGAPPMPSTPPTPPAPATVSSTCSRKRSYCCCRSDKPRSAWSSWRRSELISALSPSASCALSCAMTVRASRCISCRRSAMNRSCSTTPGSTVAALRPALWPSVALAPIGRHRRSLVARIEWRRSALGLSLRSSRLIWEMVDQTLL